MDLSNILPTFRPPAFPGSYFLSFEGIEGAGKSTQIIKVKDRLEDQGFRVLVLREPGGTPFGEKLRSAILDTTAEIHPMAEAHLFASARAQLLTEVVLKELDVPGTIIICDRYIDSSIAYQGHARGFGVPEILNFHKNFPLNLVPHMTFYIRISVETSLERQKIRNAPKDYFESKGADFYQKLIEGYDIASEIFKERVKIIDGNGSFESVNGKINNYLDQLVLEQNK